MMTSGVSARATSRGGYQRPENVVETTIGRLLASTPRRIPEKQQARFGFAAEQAASSKLDGLKLWVAGDPALVSKPGVAIVGTRKVSSDGAKRARRLAKELVDAGVVVVSGLAEGVDTHALSSAIEAGGKTIAVIGTPIDKAYPARNASLQATIAADHLLVSQFAPDSAVHKGNFPTRNKLMAALSDATVIIEASDTSGTLHQAAECIRLGRLLFIARSVVNDQTLTWPASFMKEPLCHVLETTSDILRRLGAGGWESK